jgi:predicted phosphoribosyltransferase
LELEGAPANFPARPNTNFRAGAWVIAMMSLEQILQVNAAREQPAKVEKLVVDLPPKVKVPLIHPVTRMTDHAAELIDQEEAMLFRDRNEAGQQLAAVLKERGFDKPIVLGIPRGGVPVAAEVARALGGDLAVVVARKLGAPGNPELAIGATTETGASYINTAVATAAGADERYIEAEKQRQVKEAHRREELFDSHRRPPIRGRTVIIVDDGIATGATAIAAVRSVKAGAPERVILAVPVGPPEMVELLRSEADEVVCLEEDPGFWAVGQYYLDFSPVSDEEVRATLEGFRPSAVVAPQTAGP